MYPDHGPIEGNYTVTIQGNFFLYGNFKCKFDNVTIDAVTVNSNNITCQMPSVNSSQVIQIDVLRDDQKFTTTSGSFTYVGKSIYLLFTYL